MLKHFITSLFALLIVSMFFVQQSTTYAVSAGTMYLDPHLMSVNEGDFFSVIIIVDAASSPLNSAKAILSYDSSVLEVMAIDLNPSNAFDMSNPTPWDTTTITLSASNALSRPSDGELGIVHFKGKSFGLSNISFAGTSELIDSDTNNILFSPTGGIYTVNQVTTGGDPGTGTGGTNGAETTNTTTNNSTTTTNTSTTTGTDTGGSTTTANNNSSNPTEQSNQQDNGAETTKFPNQNTNTTEPTSNSISSKIPVVAIPVAIGGVFAIGGAMFKFGSIMSSRKTGIGGKFTNAQAADIINPQIPGQEIGQVTTTNPKPIVKKITTPPTNPPKPVKTPDAGANPTAHVEPPEGGTDLPKPDNKPEAGPVDSSGDVGGGQSADFPLIIQGS